jgi:hypothetical protein
MPPIKNPSRKYFTYRGETAQFWFFGKKFPCPYRVIPQTARALSTTEWARLRSG